jgi:DnaJ-class molecular chaperone
MMSNGDRSTTGSKSRGGAGGSGSRNPEAVAPDTPGAGENICRKCGGGGRIDSATCPDCGGTGKITEPLGGA